MSEFQLAVPLLAAAAAILVTMTLALIRAMAGPTVFDRVLALNMFGTKTVLLICVVGFLIKRTDFLDLALLYSLMNFTGMVALLRYTRYGTFGDDGLDDAGAMQTGSVPTGSIQSSRFHSRCEG
ncbi:MAG: monovalent cation/H+ antiporter complex subunit F [Planctomycetota bacterium]